MKPSCSICASTATLQEKRLALYFCSNCTHTFTDAQEDPNLYHETYYAKERKNWFEHPDYGLFEIIYNKTVPKRSTPQKLIDIGCGNGAFLKYIRERNAPIHLFGIDLSSNITEGITFYQSDFRNISLKGTFDIICSFMAIEHIRDVHLFVKKINLISNRHTILCINTINNNSLIYRTARFFNKLGWRVPHDRLYSRHHLNHFTNTSLRLLLEKNGWATIEHWNHNYPLAAVDVPETRKGIAFLYRIAVAGMFTISNLIGNGQAQTIICRKTHP